MIKWTDIKTFNNYPFKAYRTLNGYGNKILLTDCFSVKSHKSLTNNIEHVIWHFIMIRHLDKYLDGVRFYQWVPEQGLFELSYDLQGHNDIVTNVRWKHLSNKLETFAALYCKGVK